jgi:AcrR family transcriptional regulator
MARTINPAAHAVRRDAFLDAAERLIQEKGYEQMSVQDVLDAVDVSRGAFYHYFDSKVALLEALIERMIVAATATLEPDLSDPRVPALRKLERLFSGIARWKAERTDLLLAVLQVWFSDENAIVRDKLRQGLAERFTPLLAAIVQQGQAEGTFSVGSPDATAHVLVSLLQGANESASQLFVARQANTVPYEVAERTLGAYIVAFERILGAPAGSWPFDRQTLHQWYG